MPSSDKEASQENILSQLSGEREFLALRHKHERVLTWLSAAQALPQIIDRNLTLREIYLRLGRALISGLRLPSVAFFELKEGAVCPIVPPGEERLLSDDGASFLRANPAGVCNDPVSAEQKDVSKACGLHRYLWGTIRVSGMGPVLMAVGYNNHLAKFHAKFDDSDAVNIANLARHLEMLIGNTLLLNQLEEDKSQLLESNAKLKSRDQELHATSVQLQRTNESLELKVRERTAELAQRSREMGLILNSAEEGFLGISESGTVTFANPAAGHLLGVPSESMLGKPLTQSVGHGCAPDTPCHYSSCPILRPFSDGLIHRATNWSFIRQDGSALIVDYCSTPAREDEKVAAVVLAFRDMTQQRRMEAQVLQGEKLQAIGQLAAGIAHEINTPMQYIGDNVYFMGEGFSDLLGLIQEYRKAIDELEQDSRKAEILSRIQAAEKSADIDFLRENAPNALASATEGIERVRKIVYAMKEFSRPGASEKTPSDLNQAVENALTISTSTWKEVATVECDLSSSLPLVFCMPGEINQVILNLIVNACHAIADFRKKDSGCALGKIRIETGVSDNFAEIRISDTGGGIPLQHQKRIFEPFFTTKEVGRGSGQGLSISRTIIENKHGGHLDFSTEIGKGTVFTVRLPLNPPEETE